MRAQPAFWGACFRLQANLGWQRRQRWALRVVVEGFGGLAAALTAPHLPHQVMKRPNRVIVERLRLKRLVITLLHGSSH